MLLQKLILATAFAATAIASPCKPLTTTTQAGLSTTPAATSAATSAAASTSTDEVSATATATTSTDLTSSGTTEIVASQETSTETESTAESTTTVVDTTATLDTTATTDETATTAAVTTQTTVDAATTTADATTTTTAQETTTTAAETTTSTAPEPFITFAISLVDSGSYTGQVLYTSSNPSSGGNVRFSASGAPDSSYTNKFTIDDNGILRVDNGQALCATLVGLSSYQNPATLNQCSPDTFEANPGPGARRLLRCTRGADDSLGCTMRVSSTEYSYQVINKNLQSPSVNVAYTSNLASYYQYIHFKAVRPLELP